MTGKGLARRESGGTCSMSQRSFEMIFVMGGGFTTNSRTHTNTPENGKLNPPRSIRAWKG